MSKTKELEIECDSASISGLRNGRVNVVADGIPDIDHILNSIDNDDMINWIARNLNPDDIFSTTELEKWAESEGYSK